MIHQRRHQIFSVQNRGTYINVVISFLSVPLYVTRVLELTFWFCIIVAFHTYLLFPLTIGLVARVFRVQDSSTYDVNFTPPVTVVISAFNEESTIRRRIENLASQDYPIEKMTVLIGSDGSTDATNTILHQLSVQYSWLNVVVFEDNRGKSNVINDLVLRADSEILVLTDADIVFSDQALRQLVLAFQNESVGAVAGTRLVDVEQSNSSIVSEESSYLSFDNRIRQYEGECGCVIGAHGSLFALRRDLFQPLPSGKYYTDDMYYSMLPLEKGYTVVAAPLALSYSVTAEDARKDFRRRVRYSSTGFATLLRFGSLLFNKRLVLSYCFWSHRVLRWFFPLFMIGVAIANVLLLQAGTVYVVFFWLQVLFYLSAITGMVLASFGVQSGVLRFSYYFVMSNAALLFGFFRFLSGRNSNTWRPTR